MNRPPKQYIAAASLALVISGLIFLTGSILGPTVQFHSIMKEHNAAYFAHDYEKAEHLSKELIKIADRLGDNFPDQRRQAFLAAAVDEEQIGNVALSAKYYGEAGTSALKKNDQEHAFNYFNHQIRVLLGAREFDQAQTVAGEALRAANANPTEANLPERIELWLMLSRSQDGMHDLTRSRQSAWNANRLIDENSKQMAGRTKEVLLAREQMGEICLKAGDAQVALEYFGQADRQAAQYFDAVQMAQHKECLSAARALVGSR